MQGPAWPKARGLGLASKGLVLGNSKPGPAFGLRPSFGPARPKPGLTILVQKEKLCRTGSLLIFIYLVQMFLIIQAFDHSIPFILFLSLISSI